MCFVPRVFLVFDCVGCLTQLLKPILGEFMGITTAFIWLQTAIMILFAKTFLPDNMSHIWKGLFGEPILTAKQLKERKESERIARKVPSIRH
jgi:hypothetical protein